MPPTLTTGCHLYETPDGTWRYYLPGDEFVRITAPPAVLRAARTLLHGHPASGDPEAGVAELIAALDGRGALAAAPVPPRRGRVRVTGAGPIADQVRLLLGGDHDLTGDDGGTDDGGTPDGLDVVVSCAGWLPDARWRELAEDCERHGTAWHGCYAEGSRWFTGPLSVPGRTAGHLDTRARRLGACGVPEELLAHWSYLDAGSELPPVPWPPAGACALIAGLVAADVHAYLTTGTPAAEGRQLEIDPATLTVTAHPVLPLPHRPVAAS